MQTHDKHEKYSSKAFLNRELSWLRFNTRVLDQCSKDLPLLEKLKFIAIYCTNLDEFYMVRVAGLKQLFSAGVSKPSNDELTPLAQLKAIREYLHAEKSTLESYFTQTLKELEKQNLFIKNYQDLSVNLQKKCDEYFASNILALIVPIAVDSTHPFPHLGNLSFSLAVKLCEGANESLVKFGMIKIPNVLSRFYEVSSNTYVPIESIIHHHIEDIFPGYRLLESTPFRVTRNADMSIEEEEADDFMIMLEQGLQLRKKGTFVRLQIHQDADKQIIDFLNSHMKIFAGDIYEYSTLLNLPALWEIVGNKNFAHLCYPTYIPKLLPPFAFNENSSMFEHIAKEDILLFHPYESFDPVYRFIKEASTDSAVISIRMTLYRVAKNSNIVQALIDAANDGKQVTVMVELKARFDEENNLHWAKALENAGAHVIYGITGFKVHAKVCQIIRKEQDGLKFYLHLGTGNYNAGTARIYTDVSYFTSRKDYANDITTFFHILSGFNKKRRLEVLSMSPNQIKECVLKMIATETAKKGDGVIIAKMNSLVDADVIEALYEASKAGVKIDLIVRGICCLKPHEIYSANINVRSIVGKYLEHARIFYFKHSAPHYFISSADWMPRNLERRLELMTPIFDEALKAKLSRILKLQLSDNELAYELKNDGEYARVSKSENSAKAATKGLARASAKKVSTAARSVNSQEKLEDYVNQIAKTQKKQGDNAVKLVSKLFKES